MLPISNKDQLVEYPHSKSIFFKILVSLHCVSSTQDINIEYTIAPSWCESLQLQLLLNNILDKEYTSNGYFYTYDDDWSNPGSITTIEGVGYYPQAGFHFLAGMTIRF